tara:strand:- start:33 stop:227 length:195 start_codon:yes stop_codon:yes gene_type:complete
MHYQFSIIFYISQKRKVSQKNQQILFFKLIKLIKKLRRKKSSIRNQSEKYLNQNYPSTLNSNKH